MTDASWHPSTAEITPVRTAFAPTSPCVLLSGGWVLAGACWGVGLVSADLFSASTDGGSLIVFPPTVPRGRP